jgi:hypothetical protein
MRGRKGILFIAATLGALVAPACSRHPGPQATVGTVLAAQQPPFENVSAQGGMSPTASLAPAGVPVGTSLVVRLGSDLSSADSRPGESFAAVLDEPIVVQGQTIAPRGSILAGKVLAVRAADRSQQPGYLRLILNSISINGKSLPLHTSSVFMKGAFRESAPDGLNSIPGATAGMAEKRDVEFSTGQRLIFRLTRPLPAQA